MRVFVTGVAGQLGHDVVNELRGRGHEAIGSDLLPWPDRVALDITGAEEVSRVISELRPDAIVHCAAWTAVDAAEEPENREKVRAINADGTANVARAAAEAGAKLVYLSTDYVFDGSGTAPWRPDCADFAPLNYYGETKLAGERVVRAATQRHFIVRIAWVFGLNGKNFVRTMLRLGRERGSVRVVNDQIGTPTYTCDLARLLVDMLETERYGTYHATNEGGYISWAEFAREIFRQAGLDAEVVPVTTAEYGLSRAARPFNSRLDKSKLAERGFEPLPDWRDALARYLRETGESA